MLTGLLSGRGLLFLESRKAWILLRSEVIMALK